MKSKAVKIVTLLSFWYLPVLLFHWQGTDLARVWSFGVLVGSLTIYFLVRDRTVMKLSCSPTARGFHTFNTSSQWSCDCGKIRRGGFETTNSSDIPAPNPQSKEGTNER